MSGEEATTDEETTLRRSKRITRPKKGDGWSNREQSIDRGERDTWSTESVAGTVLGSPRKSNRMSKRNTDSDGDSGRGSEKPGIADLFQLMMADNKRRDEEARRREMDERNRRDEESRRREEDFRC